MNYPNYIIREMKKDEFYLLDDFLYEAIFQRDDSNLVPREVIYDPSLRVYVDNFGGRDDYCLVAEYNNKIVGAVWTRIVPGYGSIDDTTPELAISLYKDYRRKGIGTNLMNEMMSLVKNKGYKQISLSVQKDNYAVHMYEDFGFNIIKTTADEYIMLCLFAEDVH